MLRVRKSLEVERGGAGGQHSGQSSVPGTASWSVGENDSGGKMSARGYVGDGVVAVARSAPSCDVGGALGVLRVHSRRGDTAHANAGESNEERESDFSEKAGAALTAAAAGESDTNLGSRSSVETRSCHNSSTVLGVSATPHLLLLLRLLLLMLTRAPHPCMLHIIRGRTRVGLRVPREGVPKVG